MFKMKIYIPTLHDVGKLNSYELYGIRKQILERVLVTCNSR
jgi:hypothetical protein